MSPGQQPDLDRREARMLAARRRNAALVRVDSARRWVIGGSVALTAALALLVDALAPGHSVSGASAATSSSGGGSTSSGSVTSDPSSPGYSSSSGYYSQSQGSSSVTPSSGSSQSVAPVVSGGS
jgi:hypothetical protein